MKSDSNNGHYRGFWIDWYDDLLADEKRDLEYYGGLLQKKDGPLLELACGTGRVMELLLRKGIATDGLDISAPMLNICRSKLKSRNLKFRLYHQDVLEMSLPKKYQTVLVSGGSFQLIANPGQVMAALKNIYEILKPQGRFILDLWIPWGELIKNEQNVWKTGRIAKRDDGSMLVASYFKTFQYENQVQKSYFKYELYRDNQLMDTHMDEISLSWFGVCEFELMLEKTGFSEIHTDKRPIMSSHGTSTVYIAKK